MKILIYTLMVLSAGLAIAVSGLSMILGSVFQYSASSSDVFWGWVLICFGILYLAHPYLIYGLFKKGFLITSVCVVLFFIVCSVGIIMVLPDAIEASARP